RFFRISRASCREARHWLCRAKARRTLPQEIAEEWVHEATEIAKMINGLIAHRKNILPKVRESLSEYDANDPSADPFAPNSLTP
ncbi:MAG: four helix bundle protein, partial [Nostoc sp.]